VQAANELDLEAARTGNLDAPLLKRLDVRGKKFDVMLAKLDEVRAVADPIGAVQLATKLDEGLDLYRVACPIGVVAGECWAAGPRRDPGSFHSRRL
jgi:glutamate-5-semialdehyde dehydrogenase